MFQKTRCQLPQVIGSFYKVLLHGKIPSGIVPVQRSPSAAGSAAPANFAGRSEKSCKFGLFKRVPLWYIETQETRAPRDMQEVSP